MEIDYYRVFELLQDEDFCKNVRGFVLLDAKAKLEGRGYGVSILYVAKAICENTPPKDLKPDFNPEEMNEFLKRRGYYVIKIIARVMGLPEPLADRLASGGEAAARKGHP
jgi:hypothetical protein